MLGCNRSNDGPQSRVEIPDFNFPKTVVFESSLSAYGLYEGSPSDLKPSADFHLLELSSVLFTDYARKQRLVKVPAGTQMIRQEDGSIDFPEGTILVKTFFYYTDERDTSLGKRIIETRLLIKESDTWNVATYLWNDGQTDASLRLTGNDMPVSWINASGVSRSTIYHVPTENECMTCHQSSSSMSPLGPSLLNLNRMVERDGITINQINHLQSLGILSSFDHSSVPEMVDYKNMSNSLSERGRAYLAMNCSHCHNPNAWDKAAERDFDFRYQTAFDQTGIQFEKDKIREALLDREMPFIGTTVLDEEGVGLVLEYLDSL